MFQRLGALLDDIAANGNGKGYAHFSMWYMDVATPLNGQSFLEAVKKVVAAGNEVAVTLWIPTDLAAPLDYVGGTHSAKS